MPVGNVIMILADGTDASDGIINFIAGTNINLTVAGGVGGTGTEASPRTVTVDATGGGTVTGTGTDNHLMRWDGTTAAQDSAAIIDDDGNIVLPWATDASRYIATQVSTGFTQLQGWYDSGDPLGSNFFLTASGDGGQLSLGAGDFLASLAASDLLNVSSLSLVADGTSIVSLGITPSNVNAYDLYLPIAAPVAGQSWRATGAGPFQMEWYTPAATPLPTLAAADITDPSAELATIDGAYVGEPVIVYDNTGGLRGYQRLFTYTDRDLVGGGEGAPGFYPSATGGTWIQQGSAWATDGPGMGVTAGNLVTFADTTGRLLAEVAVSDIAPNASYRALLQAATSIATGTAAGTFALSYGGASVASGVGSVFPISLFHYVAADYPTVNGLATKLRIRAQVECNDVAPTGNFTIGLYPVTRPATSGGTGVNIYTLGTVVTGSNGATVATPAADSSNLLVGSDFTPPSDGLYCLGVVTTGTIAALAHVHVNAVLQMHNA